MQARAQRIRRYGGPEVIEFETIDVPQPGPGEALVRVAAAGVGPWDALVRAGRSGLAQTLPLTLGADLSGVVLSTGADAAHLNAGVEVYGVTNARFVGAYATHAIVDADRIARKPPGLGFVEAAGLPVVAVTAWKMLFAIGELHAGQHVLVHGASGNVGRLAVQLARHAGAVVTAVGPHAERERLEGDGAQRVLDDDRPFEDVVEPVDLVIDTVGGAVQERSFAIVAPGGRLVSSVQPPDAQRAAQRGILATFFIVDVRTRDLERVSALLTAGAIAPAVAAVFPLEEARRAHAVLAEPLPRRHGKIVLSASDP